MGGVSKQLSFIDQPASPKTREQAREAERLARGGMASGPLEDRSRFNRQCEAVLARLQRGAATNMDLADICPGYRQRVSDLRKAGYVIECRKRHGGLSVYSLKGKQ